MGLANKSNTKESFLDIQLTSLEITFVLDIKAFDSFFPVLDLHVFLTISWLIRVLGIVFGGLLPSVS